jgi:hypothetical protein
MDAGAMVPKFMVGRIIEKSLAQTAEALKARIRTAPHNPKYEAEDEQAAEAAAGAAAGPRPHKRKRLIHVLQRSDGYRVWVMGKTYFYKAQ